MNGNIDMGREEAALAARNDRRAHDAAEDIIERMRDLQTILGTEDMMAVEYLIQALEGIMRRA